MKGDRPLLKQFKVFVQPNETFHSFRSRVEQTIGS